MRKEKKQEEAGLSLSCVETEDGEEILMVGLLNPDIRDIDGELTPVVFMGADMAREIALGLLELASTLDPIFEDDGT